MEYSDCGLLGWSKVVIVHMVPCQLRPNSFISNDRGNMFHHNININLCHYIVSKLS